MALTHTEFLLRREADCLPQRVVLTGEVTAVDGGVAILSRWVPGCCSVDAELTVDVAGLDAAPGDWVRVTGAPAGDRVRVERTEVLTEPPPRREG
jgi:hypothetical protein